MNTSLHDLINVIESVKFDTNMSVFSGFNSFHRALAGDQTIQQLRQLLMDSPNTNEQLLNHLTSLLEMDSDLRYEHPFDIAIASYLFVLSNNVGAVGVAKRILSIPNLVWAKRLAEIVLANQTATTETEVKIKEASKYRSVLSNYLTINGIRISSYSDLSRSSTTSTKARCSYRSKPHSKSFRLIVSA